MTTKHLSGFSVNHKEQFYNPYPFYIITAIIINYKLASTGLRSEIFNEYEAEHVHAHLHDYVVHYVIPQLLYTWCDDVSYQ